MEQATILHGHPAEMFVTSLHHFRRIMCSARYTLEQKDEAWASLCQDYIRCDLTPIQVTFFVATEKEWSMRRAFEAS